MPILLHKLSFVCKIGGHGISMHRLQFPLKVCSGVTIHRAQATTLDRIVVDLRSGVFDHGQLYVALSRVRRPEDLCFLLRPEHVELRNVVFKLLLNHRWEDKNEEGTF